LEERLRGKSRAHQKLNSYSSLVRRKRSRLSATENNGKIASQRKKKCRGLFGYHLGAWVRYGVRPDKKLEKKIRKLKTIPGRLVFKKSKPSARRKKERHKAGPPRVRCRFKAKRKGGGCPYNDSVESKGMSSVGAECKNEQRAPTGKRMVLPGSRGGNTSRPDQGEVDSHSPPGIKKKGPAKKTTKAK